MPSDKATSWYSAWHPRSEANADVRVWPVASSASSQPNPLSVTLFEVSAWTQNPLLNDNSIDDIESLRLCSI
jgi:hypothetical protein